MQDIVFYVVANETLGVVRDYANAKRKSAPVLALGVSVCLRMRLFAEPNNAAPYSIDSFNVVTDWQWSMDDDFDRNTACKLVADADSISVHTVTDTINGETMDFTEFVIPISNMNTEELATWIGSGKTRSGLTGELVGYDAAGHAVFVLQVENFTVRNRVAGLADPTAVDEGIVTRAIAEEMIQTAVSALHLKRRGHQRHQCPAERSDRAFRIVRRKTEYAYGRLQDGARKWVNCGPGALLRDRTGSHGICKPDYDRHPQRGQGL